MNQTADTDSMRHIPTPIHTERRKLRKREILRRKRVLIPSALLLLGAFQLYLNVQEKTFLESHQNWFEKERDLEESKIRISNHIELKNPQIDPQEKRRLVKAILIWSDRLVIPDHLTIDGREINRVDFLTALIEVESSFQREAVSWADARGYMQLMPATVAWMDDRSGTVTDPGSISNTDVNLELGVTYLNHLFVEMKDPRLVCLAYNAGPGAVRRGFYVERYWEKFIRNYRELAQERSSRERFWSGQEPVKDPSSSFQQS